MSTHRRRGYRRSDGTYVRPTIVHTQKPAATNTDTHTRVRATAETLNTPTPEPPTPYHRRFRRFHPDTLNATRNLFRSRIHRMNPPEAVQRMQQWVNEVSAVYNTPPPTLRWTSPAQAAGHGCYIPADDEIRMAKASLMTLMHEYRHALQHRGAPMVAPTHNDTQIEEDARAWSMSLFHKVAPNRFKRLALEGKIFHVEPETLEAFQQASDG